MKVVRLASVKTAERSSGGGSSSRRSSSGAPSPQGRRNSSADAHGRDSSRLYHQAATGEDSVTIEVFGHAAIGNKEAVFVAYLSNSVLLVIRLRGGGTDEEAGGNSLRSWLLDWPVQGKIRGLCVSPDLQCVLCVTEDLEGVYILAIDNLGAGVQTDKESTMSEGENPDPGDIINDIYRHENTEMTGVGALGTSTAAGGGGDGVNGGRSSGATAGRAARPMQRAAAAAAFPSLLHLASRGQRRRAGAVAHTAAEPIFIASLARRGGRGGDGGGGGGGSQSGQEDAGRRRSAGSGKGSPSGSGRRRSRASATQLECLWWAARNGDHIAVIGRPDGEVHFLDLERLDSWVMKSPMPSIARGRVCALTINTLAAPGCAGGSFVNDGLKLLPPTAARHEAQAGHSADLHRHLVVVLETGAVFLVLLERGRPGDTSDTKGENPRDRSSSSRAGSDNGGIVSVDDTDIDGFGESDIVRSHRDGARPASEYARLSADSAEDAEFAPAWVDVGRGGSGGGGGATGVRAIPTLHDSSGSVCSDEAARLRMSVVSRAWGNKCSVRILRTVARPEMGSGRQQALRTETVRQVTLPADHNSPEQHALSAVDGNWVVLASPPAGGAPSRITVAPLGTGERPTPSSVRLFPLPSEENVLGVALFPVRIDAVTAQHVEDNGSSGTWGLVWSDAGVYRVELGEKSKARSVRSETSSSSKVPPSIPSLQPQPKPQPETSNRNADHKSEGSTTSIAVRRPTPAAVRRARELHSAGHLAEAARAAMEALDGPRASSSGSARASQGGEETGGGVTTRMVREDLANSLLEWLITLHVRRSFDHTLKVLGDQSVSSRQTAGMPRSKSSCSSIVDVGTGGVTMATSSSSSQVSVNPEGATQAQVSSRHRKQESSAARTPHKKAPASSSAGTAHSSTPPSAIPSVPARSTSRLEQFVVSSRDFDPILAARLLHAHGEADLAVVAGTIRGGIAIQGVLRVLADFLPPPRLGSLAVEALCASGTAAQAVHAGGGTLLAALDPRLQVRVLMSDRRILFGETEKVLGKETMSTPAEQEPTAPTQSEVARPLVGKPGDIRSHLTPALPALLNEELARLACRLLHWCMDDACTEGVEDTPTPVPTSMYQSSAAPPAATHEAIEVVLDVLVELSGREPPPGREHRCAWLRAGCMGCSARRMNSATADPDPEGGSRNSSGVTREEFAASCAFRDDVVPVTSDSHVSQSSQAEQPLPQWSRVLSLLHVMVREEGLGGSADGNDATAAGRNQIGGLPTAARRVILRCLRLLRGWHDPVRLLLKAKGAGCWAAVALALTLSGHPQDAASAKLHGIVCMLQGSDARAAGVAGRILSGEEPQRQVQTRQPLRWEPPPVSPLHSAAADSATQAGPEDADVASSILQIMDDYVFEKLASDSRTSRAFADGVFPPNTEAPSMRENHSSAPSVTILTRASTLAQALCVWEYFELPLASLEPALQRRLANVNDVRVLTTLFFPQLSPDVGAAAHGPGTSPQGFTMGNGWSGCNGTGGNTNRARSSGPNPAQVGAAQRLGLSPRFNLALMQASGRLAAVGVAPEAGGTNGTFSAASPPAATWFSSEHPAAALPSSLAALLKHRTEIGAPPTVWLRPTAASGTGSVAEPLARSGSAAGVGGTTNGASGKTRSDRWLASGGAGDGSSTAAAADEVVWFSCGHCFSQHHLLNTVVPASVSSLGKATSSLQRTQQLLVREYEGRGAEAACPDCAAKELRRLVSGLRPTAAAAAAAAAAADSAAGGARRRDFDDTATTVVAAGARTGNRSVAGAMIDGRRW